MKNEAFQPGDFVLVRHGESGQQVAVVESVDGATLTIRKYIAASSRFTAPATIAVRRVVRAPDDDPRIEKARSVLKAETKGGST